ncbi:MAG: hypothetical protein PSN34_12495 [Urechidicola sp.]|nr:hypothetical protein [Urechidicola sp.]
MKKSDIPQDRGSDDPSNFNELYYATDTEGNYVTGKSTGWDPKKIALDNAIEEIQERAEKAKQRVLNKETSPIEYYMELNKMDIPILASYVGFWSWRVKRHLKVKVFHKLSEKKLKKYADLFEISINQLKDIEYGN